MPPGFISLAANRANAADLIRGRGALRTLPAFAQTAGTAVSLLPPQNVAGSNPSPSLQAAFDRFQTSRATMRALTQENTGRFQLEEASEGQSQNAAAVHSIQLSAVDESQQRIFRNIRGPEILERSSRVDMEPIVSSVANENIGGMIAPSQRLTREREAARPANYIETVENSETSAADTTSFREPELPHWDMSTAGSRAEWTQGRLDARARFKAEARAVELGQILPPVDNPSPRHATLLQLPDGKARMGTRSGDGPLCQSCEHGDRLIGQLCEYGSRLIDQFHRWYFSQAL